MDLFCLWPPFGFSVGGVTVLKRTPPQGGREVKCGIKLELYRAASGVATKTAGLAERVVWFSGLEEEVGKGAA